MEAGSRALLWRVALAALAAAAAVAVAIVIGASLASWTQKRCADSQQEAKTALLRVLALERAYRDAHGAYGRSLEAIGYDEEPVRYDVHLVEAAADGFVAEAIGTESPVEDDLWRVNHRGELRALLDACAPGG